jgi:hypothetical protein
MDRYNMLKNILFFGKCLGVLHPGFLKGSNAWQKNTPTIYASDTWFWQFFILL